MVSAHYMTDRVNGKSMVQISDRDNELEFCDADLIHLNPHSISEILPGTTGKYIVLRAKLWNLIQLYQEKVKAAGKVKDVSEELAKSRASHELEKSWNECNKSPGVSSITSSPGASSLTSSPGASLITRIHGASSITSSSPVARAPQFDERPSCSKTYKFIAPEYTVYGDPELDRAAQFLPKFSDDLKNRLARGVIDNMVAAAGVEPYNRWPYPNEVREVGRAVLRKYPLLEEKEIGNGDGKYMIIKLLRRLENKKHEAKLKAMAENGEDPKKNPKSSKKRKIKSKRPSKKRFAKTFTDEEIDEPEISDDGSFPHEEDNDFSMVSSKSNDSDISDIDSETEEEGCNREVMARHYKEIQKIQKTTKKKDETKKTLNYYLNLEFKARRNWLKVIESNKRIAEIMDYYSCFQDHIEIIEEVRRVLGHETSDRMTFTNACVQRLDKEMDNLIYFGVGEKRIEHPARPGKDHALHHILQNIGKIFPDSKKQKKIPELIYKLEDKKNVSTWISKRSAEAPILVLTSTDIYLIVGTKILSSAPKTEFAEIFIAYLATFYLLDLEYPHSVALGLSMLQYLIFQSNAIQRELMDTFTKSIECYEKFKSS